MCMSPDEMTSERLEHDLQYMKEAIARGEDVNYWEFRAEEIEKLLKERAEEGTYETAGIH
jgi:hypothetical protein